METTKRFIPKRRSNIKCITVILLLLLLIMYVIDNSSVSPFIDSFTFTYIIKPILWFGISIFIWNIPKVRPKGKLKHKKLTIEWAFIFGIMFISINIFAGFIFGLGKSPYNHSLLGIITNIIFIGSLLVGREFIRNYLVNLSTKKENYTTFIVIALLFTLTHFNINRYTQIKGLESLVQFLAEFFAPEFSHNLFATYLVFIGGPLPSIIYLGIMEAFHWLSPILPNLKWIITALVGILCPVFFLMTFQTIYLSTTRQIKKRELDDESTISWIITSIISIGIIWFAVGVFPIYPSVIATGSMEPMIKPGDVILVRKIVDMDGINALKAGDVIQFKRDEILISHRITEIIEDEKEGLQLRTKGDNNSAIDSDPVKPQDVKGTIEHVVPKVGWPTLLIKSDKNIDLDKIDF